MFCLSMEPNHLKIIKEFNYLPVGLGGKNFSQEWYLDHDGKNISEKNRYYGEYTFHYWLWKNYLDNIAEGWIGFCQYRKFWSVQNENLLPNSLNELKSLVLKRVPADYEKFDVILGMEIVEHVEDINFFIKKSSELLKKNGLMFIATLNKTLKSYVFAIVGAEYILRWLPIGTHDWNKFIKPDELIKITKINNLKLEKLDGINFDLLTNE